MIGALLRAEQVAVGLAGMTLFKNTHLGRIGA